MKTPTQNRVKSTRPRPARDFYETPYDLCYKYLSDHVFSTNYQPLILDAGAGNGIWGKAAKAIAPRCTIVGIDIERRVPTYVTEYDDWITGDYLDLDSHEKFDIIIGNPPYSLAERFVRKSLYLMKDVGSVHFLLPLAFLGSMKRSKGFFQDYPPSIVRVSSRRPSFFSVGGKKTTDAIEYAMYKWIGDSSEYPSIRWFNWDYHED